MKRFKKKKKLTPWHSHKIKKRNSQIRHHKKTVIFCATLRWWGGKRRWDKRDHLSRWVSTYTVQRKEWSGRAQTQANDSVSLRFSWTCPLNWWKETQHMNKQRWRGRVWSESSADTGSRSGRWGMARMVTTEMKKQWKRRSGGWNIASPCHPPLWELYEGQADVKEEKEKAKIKTVII